MTPEETIREALRVARPDILPALDALVAERDRLGWALEPFAAWKDPPYGFLDDVETARLAFKPQGTNP